MFWFFYCESCGILVPWPVTEPASPALQGEVLTIGQPGKTQTIDLYKEDLQVIKEILNHVGHTLLG